MSGQRLTPALGNRPGPHAYPRCTIIARTPSGRSRRPRALPISVIRYCLPAGLDKVCDAFCHHYHRRVDRGAYQVGHDRRINDAHPFHALHFPVLIDYGQRVFGTVPSCKCKKCGSTWSLPAAAIGPTRRRSPGRCPGVQCVSPTAEPVRVARPNPGPAEHRPSAALCQRVRPGSCSAWPAVPGGRTRLTSVPPGFRAAAGRPSVSTCRMTASAPSARGP